MELSNAEREMLWAEGWNDLYDAVAQQAGGYLVDEDWRELTVDECEALIQTTAYDTGRRARFRATFYKGKASIQLYFD